MIFKKKGFIELEQIYWSVSGRVTGRILVLLLSLADRTRRSATCSVLTYLGHKEDEVVKAVSEHLSAALDTRVVVTAGMHWDGLDQIGISVIEFRIEEIIHQLTAKLQKQGRAS